ncbi:MAG: hypothetical protein WC750_06070 [Patescibacteria group bacterium]|jgi:hypothetical protein
MDLSRLLSGGVAFQTNVPVYLATTVDGLKKGAVVCSGATGSTRGFTLSVATTTAACKDVQGVLMEGASFSFAASHESTNGKDASSFRIQEDLIADRGAVGGNDWLPAIINPDALWFAWYSTSQAAATASDTITQSITASTGTVVTIASLDQDQIGGWIFSVNSNSVGTPTYYGQLRYITTATQTGICGLATAMNLSTDSSLIIADPIGIIRSVVGPTGRYLRSQGAAGLKVAQGIYQKDVVGCWDSAPMHPLRKWVDDGKNSLTGVRLYGEVYLFDWYAFNESIA